MTINFPSPEFDQAVAAVCHDSASDEQVRALNELLRRHPGARDEYILRLELHSRLASDPDLFASEATEPLPSPENVLSLRPERRVEWPARALALAACVALLVVGGWWLYPLGSSPRKGETSKAIAMLNRVANVVWQEPGAIPQVGAPLEPGWLRIKSGLAQIVFYGGARMVIEGPAELQLVSSVEVVCQAGRLVAEVPPPAKGFKVRTPQMNVTDLGTIFGVDVASRQTELHVFQGTVEFDSRVAGTRRNVGEGQGAIVADGAAEAQLVPSNRTRFASLFNLQNKSSEGEVLRHEQWRSTSSRLGDDSSLLVHFDFESGSQSDWRLPNASKRTDAAPDGTIVGCQWTEGRWAGKQALEFRGVSDRVRLEASGEYDALTLAAWVRVQGLDREINSLFMSDGFDGGTVHWCIRHDGVLGLTAIGSEPGRYQICASPPAVTLDQLGLWLHLAVVIDGESRRVTHYLNGVPVSAHALRVAPPFRIGVAELGNWNARGFPKNDPFMIRNFSGAMDEFLLFGRALSPDEIRTMYSAGRP